MIGEGGRTIGIYVTWNRHSVINHNQYAETFSYKLAGACEAVLLGLRCLTWIRIQESDLTIS